MKTLFVLLFAPLALSAGCKSPSADFQAPQATAAAPAPAQAPQQAPTPKAPVKTAYGTAEFGMSFDQVAALPQFKDWFLDKDTPAISNFQEKIGELTYRVTLFFYQDRLYRVDITTADDLYKPVSRYETEIRSEVANLRDYFGRTYGKPTTDNGMPRSTGLEPGYVVQVYRWRLAGKTITIGISESRDGGEFKTVAQFYDTADFQAYQAQK